MADPYGNYLANLSPFAGPGLAPLGMTPEQASLYGMPKAPEAMDPGLSSLVGRVGAELGLEGLQNMADLGHGIDPRYNSAGLDVGPKAFQALTSLGAGAMRGMMFAEPGAAGVFGGRAMRSLDPKLAKTAGLDRIGKIYNPTSPRDYYVKQGDKFVNSTSHTWDDYTHRYNPSTGVMEPIQMTPEGKFIITGPGELP
jgi:hypothetical protein